MQIIVDDNEKKRLLEIINHYESCPESFYCGNNYNENIEFINLLREIL